MESAAMLPFGSGENYTYVMTWGDHTVEIRLDVSPDHAQALLQGFAQVLGFDWDELSVAIYCRQGDAGVWQPLHGISDRAALLFPLPVQARDDLRLTDKQYVALGQRILSAYEGVRERLRKVEQYQRRVDDTSQKQAQTRKTLWQYVQRVEQTIVGTQWEELFRKRYEDKRINEIAAMDLHVSLRKLDRDRNQMYGHVGQILHETMRPKDLRELLAHEPLRKHRGQ